MSAPIFSLVQAALAGQRRAVARLLSLVENADARERDDARAALAQVYPHTGQAQMLGVTGAPGSGKSTLVAQIAAEYRRRGRTVGIVAVDPTSPFSGGALLGDRIRMQALSGDAGVFIRSMASRGSLGGLARNTSNVVKALDACGYQRLIIETVGVGQTETDIARTAHTTLVIQVPGMGDEIQTLKAGILEIADLLVVNKADHLGADHTVAALRAMLELSPRAAGWQPPILPTVATTGQGVAEVVDATERHVAYLRQSGQWERQARARAADELEALLREELWRRHLAQVGETRYAALIEQVATRQLDPYTAAEEILHT
jgi:LAO/AO transport system kinase